MYYDANAESVFCHILCEKCLILVSDLNSCTVPPNKTAHCGGPLDKVFSISDYLFLKHKMFFVFDSL